MNINGVDVALGLTDSLTVTSEFEHEQPCPVCGMKLSAPTGTYIPDETGFLVIVDKGRLQ